MFQGSYITKNSVFVGRQVGTLGKSFTYSQCRLNVAWGPEPHFHMGPFTTRPPFPRPLSFPLVQRFPIFSDSRTTTSLFPEIVFNFNRENVFMNFFFGFFLSFQREFLLFPSFSSCHLVLFCRFTCEIKNIFTNIKQFNFTHKTCFCLFGPWSRGPRRCSSFIPCIPLI